MSKIYVWGDRITNIEAKGAENRREAYFPGPHYDKSARRRFESKQEKRDWMKKHGFREAGLYKPNKEGL